jgi:hypothetical protein
MFLPVFVLLAQAAAAPATPARAATDLSLHTVRAPGLSARFVDWHWRPELFEGIEKGGSTIPEAKRDWMVVRIVTSQPFTVGGARIPLGNYGLALWPNLDGKGASLELRHVNMSTVILRNAMASLPAGETVFKVPARFETTAETAPRMDVKVAEAGQAVNLELRYGNRKLTLKFDR